MTGCDMETRNDVPITYAYNFVYEVGLRVEVCAIANFIMDFSFLARMPSRKHKAVRRPAIYVGLGLLAATACFIL